MQLSVIALLVVLSLQGCATIVSTATGPLAGVTCPTSVIISEKGPGFGYPKVVAVTLSVIYAPFITAGGVLAGFTNGLREDLKALNGEEYNVRNVFEAATCGLSTDRY